MPKKCNKVDGVDGHTRWLSEIVFEARWQRPEKILDASWDSLIEHCLDTHGLLLDLVALCTKYRVACEVVLGRIVYLHIDEHGQTIQLKPVPYAPRYAKDRYKLDAIESHYIDTCRSVGGRYNGALYWHSFNLNPRGGRR